MHLLFVSGVFLSCAEVCRLRREERSDPAGSDLAKADGARVGLSWYILRSLSPSNAQQPFPSKSIRLVALVAVTKASSEIPESWPGHP